MMQTGYWLGLCLGLSLSGSVYADLKVLFTFDASGIKVQQVVETTGSAVNYRASLSELPVTAVENTVTIRWMAASGQLLAVTHMPDPRITSSPEHVNPSSVTRVGLIEGAWVGDGPAGTERVTVEFSGYPALGLAPESWSVTLRENQRGG